MTDWVLGVHFPFWWKAHILVWSVFVEMNKRFDYLIKLQYLGFRYSGWIKQPNATTVQEMLEKTLRYVLGEVKFKTLGASRTDAKVSANDAAFELFVWEKLDEESFIEAFNSNLPFDIRAISIEELDSGFNIIQHPKEKEYIYLFSHGAKNHPFCAPLMAYIEERMDIALMEQGASLFEGEHYFGNYCTKPPANTELKRTIIKSEIIKNELYTANFFPEESYLFKVVGEGFLRYQIRWMMGTLFSLGLGQLTLDDIKESLVGSGNEPIGRLAPASGLILNKIDFKK